MMDDYAAGVRAACGNVRMAGRKVDRRRRYRRSPRTQPQQHHAQRQQANRGCAQPEHSKSRYLRGCKNARVAAKARAQISIIICCSRVGYLLRTSPPLLLTTTVSEWRKPPKLGS